MKWLFELLVAAIYSLLIQNLIFNSGLSLSETIRMARRPKFFAMYTITIVYYTSVTSLVCSLIDLLPKVRALGTAWHVLIYAAAISVIQCVIAWIVSLGIYNLVLLFI